jgi:hypothetical protein
MNRYGVAFIFFTIICGVIIGGMTCEMQKHKTLPTITITPIESDEIICVGGKKYRKAYYVLEPVLTKEDKQVKCNAKSNL